MTPTGKRVVRRFSVAKYREEEAQRIAEELFAKLMVEHCPYRPTTRKMRLPERMTAMPDRLLNAVQQEPGLRSDTAVARGLANH